MTSVHSPRAIRMWGVRCALDTGVARALGLTTIQLEALLESRSLAQIAADRGVPMPGLRQLAWTIAEPQLAAAVAAGVIDDHERTALHRRIEEKRGPWGDLSASRSAPAHASGLVRLVGGLVVGATRPRARRIGGGKGLLELLVQPGVVFGCGRDLVAHAGLTYAVLTCV